ncbi:hypothetical protein BFP97_11830 [Roseivirga sp. 4D4]|uniref:hypothetical protein n=1 Tax=Roseivirga sp. 4D4 TaxID=1889784 RepID=UPI00085364BA|nr:hypothetical protein [Roseivirga sp. 4D4]OEK02169.1 hypothetical protein BFP97_11830 [Roseivirga sp. 4D4]
MNNKDRTKPYLVIAIISVAIIWAGVTYLIYLKSGSITVSGSIGDSFGAVNALFSSLAFALLIYTAMMQRKELQLQREELNLTRAELKKSAEAQAQIAEINRETIQMHRVTRMAEVRPEVRLKSKNQNKTSFHVEFAYSFEILKNDLIWNELEFKSSSQDASAKSNTQKSIRKLVGEYIVLRITVPLNYDKIECSIGLRFFDIEGNEYVLNCSFLTGELHVRPISQLLKAKDITVGSFKLESPGLK